MADADGFVSAFDTLAQAIRRARGASAQARGLTLSQYALLLPLAEQEGARIGDLAAAAGVTPPTASRILDALERRDLVRRARSAHDRRAVAVSLTPAGRTVLRDQEGWMRARQESFYAGLPREEQALAPDLLRRMAALIDDLAAGPEAVRSPEG